MNYKWQIKNYHEACNHMLLEFANRHDMILDADPWVGGEPGGIASVGDYFVSMQTIYYDLLAEPDQEEFFRWTDYCDRLSAIPIDETPNFESWCKGAPRYSEEALSRIENAKKVLEDAIREEKDKFKNSIPSIPYTE